MGRDEMAIPSEMGLYYQFSVNETTGLPYDCKGYEEHPRIWGFEAIQNGVGHAIPKCPKNVQEVGGSPAMHAIFEEYAADQNKWVEDFIPTYEKMLENGYQR